MAIKTAVASPPVSASAGIRGAQEPKSSLTTPSVISAAAAVSRESPTHSFDAPAEADWHRMISVAAYHRSEKRGFSPGNALDDWLKAEAEVKLMLKSS
jgi:Protein of unknown function (DUF2934)